MSARTEVLAPTKANVARAARVIREGGLVGMPTETVYGLGANAFDAAAVAKVFAAKERPTFDPLIVHVAAPASARERDLRVLLEERELVDGARLCRAARARAARLASAFWPGPLTMVLPRGPRIPDLVTSGLDTVAVRMPRHRVAQALLRAAGVPIAAPSANRFGRISPTRATDVVAELDGRVDVVLDGGRCEVGLESTIVGVAPDGALTLLRPGGAPVEAIAEVAGVVPEAVANVLERAAASASAPARAPGMLASHYAPRKPLLLLEAPLAESDGPARFARALGAPVGPEARAGGSIGRAALLLTTGRVDAALARLDRAGVERPPIAVSLSARGDLAEAAQNLFATLRALDADPRVDRLVVEPPPEGAGGLAHAIRDRLQRASHDAANRSA